MAVYEWQGLVLECVRAQDWNICNESTPAWCARSAGRLGCGVVDVKHWFSLCSACSSLHVHDDQ